MQTRNITHALYMTALVVSLIVIGGCQVAGVTPNNAPQSHGTHPDGTPATITPFILSNLEGRQVVNFWTGPTGGEGSIAILYPNWEIILFGENQTYNIMIGGERSYNGTVDGYTNITHYQGVGRITVNITLGDEYYIFNIVISNRVMDQGQFEEEQGEGSYTLRDVDKARVMGAVGVLLVSLGGIPASWFAVREYKKRQGVRQW